MSPALVLVSAVVRMIHLDGIDAILRTPCVSGVCSAPVDAGCLAVAHGDWKTERRPGFFDDIRARLRAHRARLNMIETQACSAQFGRKEMPDE